MAMHGNYRHLSRDERGKIMFMFRWGKNCSEIAALLGRHRSTIRRELRRNVSQYDSCYADESAQIRADRRRERASHRGRLRDADIRSYVEEKLAVGWSPEQPAEILLDRGKYTWPVAGGVVVDAGTKQKTLTFNDLVRLSQEKTRSMLRNSKG